MKKETANKSVLLLLVLFISALFLSMVRNFLMAIFLAGIFSALAYPMYSRFVRWFGGRRAPASGLTIFVILFVILLPLGGLVGIVTSQAINVGISVRPWIEKQLAEPDALVERLGKLPFAENIRERTQQELFLQKIIMEGVISIESEMKPRVLERKLKSFLTPSSRKSRLVSLKKIQEKFNIRPEPNPLPSLQQASVKQFQT